MRQHIAALTAQAAHTYSNLQAAHHANVRASRELDQLRWQMNRLKESLGEHFVGFDPVRYESADSAAAYYRDGDRPFLLQHGATAVECYAAETSVGVDRLRDRIHFYVKLADGYVAYALTSKALFGSPEHALATQMAVGMTPTLLAGIRQARAEVHK
jgi:hypothetical protein